MFFLSAPSDEVVFPEGKAVKSTRKEIFEEKDYTTVQMIKRFTFWRAFICLVCLTAVGNSVISFARDLVLSVGAEASLASTLVGVLSIFNGLGRIFTGALFDSLGRRITMLVANFITIFAAAITLLSVFIGSLPLCIVGLCLRVSPTAPAPLFARPSSLPFTGASTFRPISA